MYDVNMSRTKKLLSRPELPSLDEITKDLESAPSDDVAFTFLKKDITGTMGTAGAALGLGIPHLQDSHSKSRDFIPSGESSARVALDTSKSFESAAKRPRQESSKSVSSSARKSEEQLQKSKEEREIEDCYQKVLKFLEMNSYLRDSQEKMSQQCADLQELGQTVKDQIDSLRTRLHTS
ncbi:uncharacterized protein LOC121416030 [Lytechinus variegatus]|uniref:uncharacterized protein LOC121416030 n=1 Tax=Lytechinus variegatus TaxID=7654 RepID=UPI001BB2715A|nr:uncharacterized protein LOC121416030 [Lytechinus variegatus]